MKIDNTIYMGLSFITHFTSAGLIMSMPRILSFMPFDCRRHFMGEERPRDRMALAGAMIVDYSGREPDDDLSDYIMFYTMTDTKYPLPPTSARITICSRRRRLHFQVAACYDMLNISTRRKDYLGALE